MFDQIALLKGVADARERKELVVWMLNRVNLYEHRKKALSSFSGGMRQRFRHWAGAARQSPAGDRR